MGRESKALGGRARRRRRRHANRKIFEVDLAGATNLQSAAAYDTYPERQASTTVGANTQPLGCFLDGGTDAELAALAAPVTPVAKSTYLDLSPAGVDFIYNKVEGIALLEGVPGIAVANDNDFALDQDVTTNLSSEASQPDSQLRVYTTRPAQLTAPSISGTAKAGRTLTCDPGTIDGVGTVSVAYTWKRGSTPISGAQERRLTLTTEDVGSTISCSVVRTRSYGSVSVNAAPADSTASATVADFDTGATARPARRVQLVRRVPPAQLVRRARRVTPARPARRATRGSACCPR